MRLFFLLILLHNPLSAAVLHTGYGQHYANITAAARVAGPGDTILIHNGTYPGDQSLQNLKGAPGKWIYILAKKRGAVVYEGGNFAWHGSDVAYVQNRCARLLRWLFLS